jgi:hypothetical protein
MFSQACRQARSTLTSAVTSKFTPCQTIQPVLYHQMRCGATATTRKKATSDHATRCNSSPLQTTPRPNLNLFIRFRRFFHTNILNIWPCVIIASLTGLHFRRVNVDKETLAYQQAFTDRFNAKQKAAAESQAEWEEERRQWSQS